MRNGNDWTNSTRSGISQKFQTFTFANIRSLWSRPYIYKILILLNSISVDRKLPKFNSKSCPLWSVLLTTNVSRNKYLNRSLYAKRHSALYWRNDTLLLFPMTVGSFTCSSMVLKIYNLVPPLHARPIRLPRRFSSKIRRLCSGVCAFFMHRWCRIILVKHAYKYSYDSVGTSPVFPALPWIIAEALKKTVRTSSKRLRFRL